jgi:hypothetical protein
MTKPISLFLIVLLLLSAIACGGSNASANVAPEPTPEITPEPTLTPTEQAYKASAEAFTIVDEAYKMTEEFGEDLYEAWRMGIYDDDEVSIDYLAKKLNLSKEEISAAIDNLGGEGVGDYYFTYYKNKKSLFSACVWVVCKAYELNGDIDKITELLSSAKGLMKDMSQKYSDYEHYPNLKGYYTTTNAFFEFCQNPTGSFEQVKDTINQYRNDARSYRNELAYIFED